jgi:hypothetical protein
VTTPLGARSSASWPNASALTRSRSRSSHTP